MIRRDPERVAETSGLRRDNLPLKDCKVAFRLFVLKDHHFRFLESAAHPDSTDHAFDAHVPRLKPGETHGSANRHRLAAHDRCARRSTHTHEVHRWPDLT